MKVWLYKGERLAPRIGREEDYRAPRRAPGRGELEFAKLSKLGISRQLSVAGSELQGFLC